MEFLTQEEVIQVDAALLSSKEKFSTRLALYAKRCLQQISKEKQIDIESIQSEQIQAWIRQDEVIQKQIELDNSFEAFFTKLVISSLKPLRQIASEENQPVESLTVKQVIAWFEQQSKKNLAIE
ncbi:MAG: hypothetical protein WBA77_20765 [Microcoleaceae cyanobacterium]